MTLHAPPTSGRAPSFDERFKELFGVNHPRIFRYMYRLAGDAELAADIAQETFARLHRRGSMPDHPESWLITVALNLFRNDRTTRSRRRSMLTAERAAGVHSDPPASPVEGTAAREAAEKVRAALSALPERDRLVLLLRAEGYRYRDIAAAVDVNESSVGTLLARARSALLDAWQDGTDAR